MKEGEGGVLNMKTWDEENLGGEWYVKSRSVTQLVRNR